jgi:hypothetical protein
VRVRYEEALSAYRRGDWECARAALNTVLDVMPWDGPSQALLTHIDWWIANLPPADWDGSWRLTEK